MTMIQKLEQLGYTIRHTKDGWVALNKRNDNTTMEYYRSLKAAYSDKVNNRITI